MSATIPFVDLASQRDRIRDDLDARIRAVLDRGTFILGPEVAALESALAAFCGGGHCVAVASGSDALQIALMAEDLGPADAVFLPSFTFTATAESVLLAGAVPVFVDVDESTCSLDPADLSHRIAAIRAAGRLRPRVVVAVDLHGHPADYDALAPLCNREGLLLLADAAQSFGASLHGTRTGALAPVTATSFFPAKPLGCYGDGGALFTGDADRADRYRSLRVHGAGAGKYDIVRVGLNSRLDTLQAAVLLAKLEIFADELVARQRVANGYDRRLAGRVTLPARRADSTATWAPYTVQIDNRDAVAAQLQSAGIPTGIYYPRPMHLQPAYLAQGEGAGSLPASERLASRVLSLPTHPYLGEATLDRIADALLAAV